MSLIPQAYAQTIGVPKPSGMEIQDLGLFISRVIAVAFVIAGILVFAFLVWGGLEWIMSGGDKTKTEQARNRITAALVGLAIIAAAYAVMKLIQYFFGLNVLDGGVTLPRGF